MPAPINPAAYYGNSYQYQQYQQPQQSWNTNPYQQSPLNGNTFQQPVQQKINSSIIYVSGLKEAETYPSNEPVLLIDANDPVFYLKNGNQIRIFDYAERNQNANKDIEYVTRAEFDELKKTIDDLTK